MGPAIVVFVLAAEKHTRKNKKNADHLVGIFCINAQSCAVVAVDGKNRIKWTFSFCSVMSGGVACAGRFEAGFKSGMIHWFLGVVFVFFEN